MQYSIIYSCDVACNTRLAAPPPEQTHLWTCTERSGGPDGAQMDWGMDTPQWKRGRHRKYCAILDQAQFDEFVEYVSLFAEDAETMGSIGAPGFGFGWAPAISFTGNDHDDVLQSAYVTPIPDFSPPTSMEDAPALPGFEDVLKDVLYSETTGLWNRIRDEIIETYA